MAALGCAETVQPFIDHDSKDAARVPLLHDILPEESPMVRAWRMRVMLRACDSARGMLALDVFARRVVRTMPTAEATRHCDGV